MQRIFILAILISGTLPAITSANPYFRFRPLLDVNPVSATTFEVIRGRGQGARGIWCAAAYYAQFTLGVDRGRIYLAEGSGPARTVPGRKGVLFSSRPIEGAFTSSSVTVDQPGASLLVNHAIQFCRDYDYEFE